MEAGRRVFSDAKKGSPSGCKKLGKHGSRKGAVRRWALENKEAQQGGHGLFQRKYAWNEKNLLKESSDSRHTVFYRYGADGQRAVKSSEQSETLYFNTMWSWMHNSSAYNTDREIKHIYLGSERLVTRTNGAGSDGHTSTAEVSTYYYHSDHLGSAHLITDYEGNEYERIEYTPYGEYWIEKRAPENKTLPFKFTGKERDEETGLYYYGARYLDPRTSRWLSTDPALGEYMAGSNAGAGGIYNQVNFNLYHYAGNNPIKYTDPNGESEQDYLTCEICSVTVGLLAAGIPGALIGYNAAKGLEKYNGPDRDAANQAAIGNDPQNPKDNPDYVRLPDSEAAFHQLNDGSKVSKYVADKVDENGGKSEIIWNDTKNELVTDQKARGTYNYGDGKIEHGIKDVIPWILLGTGKDDPSNMLERFGDTLKAAPAFFNGLFNKKKNGND